MIALYKYNVEVYSTALEVQDFPYFRLIKMLLTMQIKVRLFRQRCYMYAVTKLYYVHLLKVKRNPLTQQHQSVSQSFLKMSYMKYAIILSNMLVGRTHQLKLLLNMGPSILLHLQLTVLKPEHRLQRMNTHKNCFDLAVILKIFQVLNLTLINQHIEAKLTLRRGIIIPGNKKMIWQTWILDHT